MKNSSYFTLQWIIIALALTLEILTGLNENNKMEQWGPVLCVACFCTFAFLHGRSLYGIRNMLVFFVIAFIVSWSYENLSIVTRFPFGSYFYTDRLGPKLLYAPIVIMPSYFGTTYLSWLMAQVISDGYGKKKNGSAVFTVPIIATFIMVMWDIVMDPFMSTISKGWIWKEGGGFFGVPFGNFLGWYLCVYTFCQIFSLYLFKYGKNASTQIVSKKLYWIQPAIMYSVVPIFTFVKMLYASNVAITTADGHVWWTRDIYQTASLMTITTMLFVSIIVVIRIINEEKLS